MVSNVADGSLSFADKQPDKLYVLDSFPRVIGLCKSFDKELVLRMGHKRTDEKSVMAVLGGLQEAQRTPVFGREEEKIGFWYLRIRDVGERDYPLSGIVKVEIPTYGKPIDSDSIDRLSGALVAERESVVYGSDSRWQSLLYPISFAESVMRDAFEIQDVIENELQTLRKAVFQEAG